LSFSIAILVFQCRLRHRQVRYKPWDSGLATERRQIVRVAADLAVVLLREFQQREAIVKHADTKKRKMGEQKASRKFYCAPCNVAGDTQADINKHNKTRGHIDTINKSLTRLQDNNQLGKFELTGIPPAPRGGAQIEASVERDAT